MATKKKKTKKKPGKTARKVKQATPTGRSYKTAKYGFKEARGGSKPSKCEEHKDH